MKEDDFDEVHALWMSIHGFGIRSIDDSKEGVERFIRTKSGQPVSWHVVDGKIVGCYSLRTGWKTEDAFIMYASMRITGNMALEKQWQ